MKKNRVVLLVIFLVLIVLIILGIKFIDFDKFPLNMKLNGKSEVSININDEYNEEKASAKLFWIDKSDKVKIEGEVNNQVPGNYIIKYSYNGKLFKKNLERKVIVIDNIPPVLTLEKDNISIYTDGEISLGKMKANDNIDGDISNSIVVNNNVNVKKAGKYKINISIKDSSGNETTKDISVTVKEKPVKNGSVNARIDVYISEQKLYYYEKNKLILTSDVVTGKNDGTPRGHYKVLSKKKDVYLKGKNYLDHVDYWIAFIGRLYGIHDASWRNEFGGDIYKTDGSHGCVNMPTDKIKELYKRVEVGTAVNIYN